MSEPTQPTEPQPEPQPEPTPPPTEPEPATEVGVDPMVTTTMTKDFLTRALVNAVPGTSNATDFLGRSVVAANKDYLGRALVA